MEKPIIVDKEFWKYKQIFWKTVFKEFRDYFGSWTKFLEPIVISILTIIASVIYSLIFRGGLPMSDFHLVVISTISGLALYVTYLFFTKYFFADYHIYVDGAKYNWNMIDFSIIRTSVRNVPMWAIKLSNNKKFNVSNMALQVIQISKDNDFLVQSDKLYDLGTIDKKGEIVRESITYSRSNKIVSSGEFCEFILGEIKDSGGVFSLETSPNKLDDNIRDSILEIRAYGCVPSEKEFFNLPFYIFYVKIDKNGVPHKIKTLTK